jgi:acyl carrier protein
MLTAPTLEQIESIVHGSIRSVLADRVGEEVVRLSGSEKLNATLGLSSLELATVVVRLEAELGVDPFAKLVSITSVRSVDDLVHAYQQSFFPELRRHGEDDAVAAAVERARTRRARRSEDDRRE